MSCPACGGSSRSPVAPGYWTCTSTVVTRRPGPALYGQPGPPEIIEQVLCGHRYQEGGVAAGNAPQCGCGTFAIGACAECGKPVCGTHSALIGDRRICGDDAPAARAEAERLAAEQRLIDAENDRVRMAAAAAQREIDAQSKARIDALEKRWTEQRDAAYAEWTTGLGELGVRLARAKAKPDWRAEIPRRSSGWSPWPRTYRTWIVMRWTDTSYRYETQSRTHEQLWTNTPVQRYVLVTEHGQFYSSSGSLPGALGGVFRLVIPSEPEFLDALRELASREGLRFDPKPFEEPARPSHEPPSTG